MAKKTDSIHPLYNRGLKVAHLPNFLRKSTQCIIQLRHGYVWSVALNHWLTWEIEPQLHNSWEGWATVNGDRFTKTSFSLVLG